MQSVFINKIIDSRITMILDTISKNYPDKFNKTNCELELLYIKEHIILNNNPGNIDNPGNSVDTSVNTSFNTSVNKDTSSIISILKKVRVQKTILETQQCSARIWYKGIFDRKSNSVVKTIDNKFKVTDFKDLNIKDFTENYIIGKRCCMSKINDNKYCKKHARQKQYSVNRMMKPKNRTDMMTPKANLCFQKAPLVG